MRPSRSAFRWALTVILSVVIGTAAIAFQDSGFVPVKPGEGVQETLPATPLVFIAYGFDLDAAPRLCLLSLEKARARRAGTCGSERQAPGEWPQLVDMPASHFIFIPAVLLVGVVIGWILGSRAATDAYAAELKRREERQARKSV